jgi:hypothetical protein
MKQKREARRTPVKSADLFTELCQSWWAIFNTVPSKESILLLMSQWALETGYGKAMWNFNLGNVKGKVGGAYDWCFFACNEILSKSQAEKMQAANPDTAKITKYRTSGDCIIWFYPEHPACCFRSFLDLGEGVTDHLQLMHKRFNKAWPAVLSGDPKAYCHALKLQGYYTADESAYTKGVVRLFTDYQKSLSFVAVDLPPPTVPTGAPVRVVTLSSAVDFTPSALHVPVDAEESPLWSPYSMQLEEMT